MKPEALRLLLVEDNPADAHLFQAACAEEGAFRVTWVETGAQALDAIRGSGDFERSVSPELVLLDLNLPGMHGLEVLERLKADSDSRRIPVVIFSTSASPEDIGRCYDAHANGYLIKPIGLVPLREVVSALRAFWGRCARVVPAESSKVVLQG